MQAGYSDCVRNFLQADTESVVSLLEVYVADAGQEQIAAWRESIDALKGLIGDYDGANPGIWAAASIVLEYTIPLESRRIDAVLLMPGVVLVIEFKGKAVALQADIDQAGAYARDLRAYHRECASIPVKCMLMLINYSGNPSSSGEVAIGGPNFLAPFAEMCAQSDASVLDVKKFLSPDAYCPLPSLINAARELFKSGSLRRIHRAAVATGPTLETCARIVERTASVKRRALVLICGVPGAGKTLVGLQLAHAKFFDKLAVMRSDGEKPTASAVFLSGNGPLVEVLRYEMRAAGGDGKAFVRGVHEYVKTFTASATQVPPQHILIYDEAQRAFDAAQVAVKHKDLPAAFQNLSEPELFVKFAERIPEWCVVVGLIGSGQEIHIGEEAGLGQWRSAIEKSASPRDWDVYVPDAQEVRNIFEGMAYLNYESSLELAVTIRFHLASRLYQFVSHLLRGESSQAKLLSEELERSGYNLRITHKLGEAKEYLWNRYDGNPEARFGIVASSKDKHLVDHGILKGFKSTGEVSAGKFGKWYAEGLNMVGSCTRLDTVATEFGTQGLELDTCLLAWGTDFLRNNGEWSNQYASGYLDARRIKNAKLLRENAYRVLLTRGRDGCVVFVPPIKDKMRETFRYLLDCGFTKL